MTSITIPGPRTWSVGLALALVAGSASAQVLRSAGGTAPTAATPAGATRIPRMPYLGAWEGELSMQNDGAATKSAKLAMRFRADGSGASYAGETIVDGGAPTPHASAAATSGGGVMRAAGTTSGAGAATGGGSGGGVMVRRSGDGTKAGGPAGSDVPADARASSPDESALFVYSAQHTPLLCGLDHRCADLPPISWAETRDGQTLLFTARLVAPDSIAGTVVRKSADGVTSPAGTFALRRGR